MEQPDRIFRGCLLHFVSRNALQLGNLPDDCREDQRGVPGPAQELGLDHILAVGQDEGRIGFEQNALQRDVRDRSTQLLRPFLQLENRAADADVVSQLQILLCDLFGPVEAMDHAAQLSGRMHSQDPEGILVSIPDMEDHRLLPLPCQIQLVEKPEILRQPVLFLTLVVIVQTDFADGDHAGRIRICIQFIPVRPLFKNGSGRMNPDGRKDPSRILRRKLQHFPTGLQTHPRLDRVWDICLHQFLEELFPVPLPEGISVLAISQVPKGFPVGAVV